MALADLRRLVERATPRVEDVRSPDRTDFVRREHGHLTLREVVEAVDALEFAADTLVARGRELVAAPQAAETTPAEGGSGDAQAARGKEGEFAATTAVHWLVRAVEDIQLLHDSPPPEAAAEPSSELEEATEEAPGLQERAATARAKGAECFKNRDFDSAVQAYTEAIQATPKGNAELHTLYSNRAAARLQACQGTAGASAALADARRCTELAPDWPKGYFRKGCCLRQLECFNEACRAFEAGQALEPANTDWDKEVEKTEKLLRTQPRSLVRQLVLNLMPDLIRAWRHGCDPTGVLQVQVNGPLEDLGAPRWQLLRDRHDLPKAQLRYAFLSRKSYLANLAANLQTPIQGVGVVDLEGAPLKIAEVSTFLAAAASGAASGVPAASALVHLDVNTARTGKMVAVPCSLPCGDGVQRFLAEAKPPAPPKCSVDGVLAAQRGNGFPKELPRYIGFQMLPGGDFNYPVIDLARDAPGECPGAA